MRDLFAFLLTVAVLTTFCKSSGGNLNQQNPNSKRLETFSSRYALPTNDPALIAKLPFTFGYRFTDDYGTMQAREEKTDPNGSKTGSYSFVDASGNYRRVDYVADVHGFRATVRTNEPGIFPENPADVRVSIDNSKNLDLPIQQSIKNSPQLEYSSHILSRYNYTTNHGQGNAGVPLRSQQNTGFGYKKQQTQNGRDIFPENAPRRPVPQNEPVFGKNVNYFKGSRFPERQPVRAVLLSELDLTDPITYPDNQRLNPKEFFNSPSIGPDNQRINPKDFFNSPSIGPDNQRINPKDFFNSPGINPNDFGFDDKIVNSGYDNSPTFSLIPNPTRYPRRLRDSSRTRRKQRYEYKIHIPRGYENYPDLPLYRDK